MKTAIEQGKAMSDKLAVEVPFGLPGPVRITTPEPEVAVAEDEIAVRVQAVLGTTLERFKRPLFGAFEAGPPIYVSVGPGDPASWLGASLSEPIVTVTTCRSVSKAVYEEVARLVADESYLSMGFVTHRIETVLDPLNHPLSTTIVEPAEFAASEALGTFRDNTTVELMDVAANVARWLWWRCGGQGVFRITEKSVYWSLDGREWLLIPKAARHRQELTRHWHLEAGVEEEFASIGARLHEQASAWELFREAWAGLQLRPRGSVLLGIAAAEVGFKEWVSRLAPDCSWLLENIQSPSLPSMVAGLMPLLLEEKLNVRFLKPISKAPPVKRVIDRVDARNTIAHVPRTGSRHQRAKALVHPWEDAERVEFLLCVSDFLWLLDYFWLRHEGRSADWAWIRIRPASSEHFTFKSIEE
jgi:hypothetical protein